MSKFHNRIVCLEEWKWAAFRQEEGKVLSSKKKEKSFP